MLTIASKANCVYFRQIPAWSLGKRMMVKKKKKVNEEQFLANRGEELAMKQINSMAAKCRHLLLHLQLGQTILFYKYYSRFEI